MTDEEIRNNIKNNLVKLRKDHEKTQVDIAIYTGKKPPSVASWEQGKSLPDLQTLYRLALYYNKTLEYFYKDNGGDDHE